MAEVDITTENRAEISLQFDSGTLLLEGPDRSFQAPPPFEWDERVKRWRAQAIAYREAVTELIRRKISHDDKARQYLEFQFNAELTAEPRPYQQEAIAAWQKAGRRGTVILPTGAGKTFVAQMAIEMVARSTLVIVPTIDLMNQWYDLLLSSFNAEIGLIGGGYFEKGAIIVTTYASAFRFMERMGDQFGFLIFDECHHLNDTTLTALKNFWELGTGGYTRFLGVILFGQPQFEARLRDHKFREIVERVEVVQMPSVEKNAWDYVSHRLKAVGGEADKLFEPQAVKALAAQARTPLALGNMANMALVKTYQLSEKKVQAAFVKQADGDVRVRAVRASA